MRQKGIVLFLIVYDANIFAWQADLYSTQQKSSGFFLPRPMSVQFLIEGHKFFEACCSEKHLIILMTLI